MDYGYSDDMVRDVATEVGLDVIDSIVLPGRLARFQPAPECLVHPIRAYITRVFPQGLYIHQAEAIKIALDGTDVCLATSTASGKSMVFMTVAVQMLLNEQSGRVLSLYPAKALIQDQFEKWQTIMRAMGLTVGYIDGSVPVEKRLEILASSHSVLMTPDVAHAWLLSHVREPIVHYFLSNLRLLVLDEAHVYDGVFGTNMAYFLRRLQVRFQRRVA